MQIAEFSHALNYKDGLLDKFIPNLYGYGIDSSLDKIDYTMDIVSFYIRGGLFCTDERCVVIASPRMQKIFFFNPSNDSIPPHLENQMKVFIYI